MDLIKLFNELLQLKTYKGLKQHYIILWIYTFIIFVMATIGHVIDKKDGFTYGMIIGFTISIFLWYQYGRKYV